MSKVQESFNLIHKLATRDSRCVGVRYEEHKMIVQSLITRDEPKPVIHENTFKSFGRCPICKTNVSMKFHRSFCGECGNRIVWEGECK